MENEVAKIIGKTKVVVCTQCKLVQVWDEVEKNKGMCQMEKNSKGWTKCKNKEFWEI